jgi:DNA-binding XRE family transcriptional regulator
MRCNLDKILRHGDIALLSDLTGIHRNVIRQYRDNEVLPRIDNAYKIASYFNKTVYDIWPPN